MVDGGEVTVDVATQHMMETVAEPLVASDRAVRALALAVGIAVMDEAAIEDRFADRAESVMDNSVTKGRGGYDTVFRIEDFDGLVAARTIAPAFEFPLQAQNLLFQIGEKCGGPRLVPFPPGRAARNLSTTLRHRRFLFTDSFLLLWKWRVG